jgi:dipeptidyl aminopeptidase/acylaminoacyl peptidase
MEGVHQAPEVDPATVPALFDKTYDGGDLRLERELGRQETHTSYAVTYRSGDLRISGRLEVPEVPGPLPALVLAHGYSDPTTYVTGQGFRREQTWFARAGYVVLHVDYRNHAESSRAPFTEQDLRLGYAVDVIDAVHALRRSDEVSVDADRIGLFGRSMGGGVVYDVLVAQPALSHAAVVVNPVSSLLADLFDRWLRNNPELSFVADGIVAAHGTPEDNPRFWQAASPRPYFDRITAPVLVHHGELDESCPIEWSRATVKAMEEAGVDAQLRMYPGEGHSFNDGWSTVMRRTTEFLGANL